MLLYECSGRDKLLDLGCDSQKGTFKDVSARLALSQFANNCKVALVKGKMAFGDDATPGLWFYRVTCMQGSCSCAVRQIRRDRSTLPQLCIAADRIQDEPDSGFLSVFSHGIDPASKLRVELVTVGVGIGQDRGARGTLTFLRSFQSSQQLTSQTIREALQVFRMGHAS